MKGEVLKTKKALRQAQQDGSQYQCKANQHWRALHDLRAELKAEKATRAAEKASHAAERVRSKAKLAGAVGALAELRGEVAWTQKEWAAAEQKHQGDLASVAARADEWYRWWSGVPLWLKRKLKKADKKGYRGLQSFADWADADGY